jgi:hypothetical protein
MLKLLLLKNDPSTYLLGKLTELDEEPSLLIEDCFRVSPDGELSEFPLHTDQRDVFLTSDLIFTILDPSAALVGKYKSMVS